MTNDERRMTNDERRTTNDEQRMTNDETIRTQPKVIRERSMLGSSFGLRNSFVIRHSSFVIFTVAVIFAFTACNSSKRLTKANVDEVAEGMAKKQVESILGPPTTVDTKDFALLKKTTYVYAQGKDSVTI